MEVGQIKEQESNYNSKINLISLSNIPGGAIRDVAQGILKLSNGLEPYFKVKAIVIDTNIILKELRHIYLKKKTTSLFNEASCGFIRLIATPTVISEVVEHIPDIAKKIKIDPNLLFQEWENYKSVITVIEPEKQDSFRIQGLLKRDPDDVPTAQLIEIISPELALSADKDLGSFGFTQSEPGDWLKYVLKLSDTIERDVIHIILIGGSTAIVFSLAEGLKLLYKSLISIIKKAPKGVLGLLGILTAAILIDSRSRNWLSSKVKGLLIPSDNKLKSIQDTLWQLGELLVKKHENWNEADKFLRNYSQLDTVPSTLKGYVIRVLAKSHNSLSITELIDNVKEIGYKPKGEHVEQYLKRILRKDSIFVKDKNKRWKLNIGG